MKKSTLALPRGLEPLFSPSEGETHREQQAFCSPRPTPDPYRVACPRTFPKLLATILLPN
jgi:hypothetical protein